MGALLLIYAKNITFNKDTGEIIDRGNLKLDEEKIRKVTRKYSCVQIDPNLYQFLYTMRSLKHAGK